VLGLGEALFGQRYQLRHRGVRCGECELGGDEAWFEAGAGQGVRKPRFRGPILEAANLIERRRSPEDRRRHWVELTDAGAKQLATVEVALAAVDEEVLCALDESQRETLYSLLLQAARGTATSCPEATDE
jgi:hypothetical protein